MSRTGIRMATAVIAATIAIAPVGAQKIESIVQIPQKKTKDKIVPTVKPEALRPSQETVAGAEGAMRCPGNGFAQHVGAPKKDLTVSGQPWLDKVDGDTDDFRGDAYLETGAHARVHPPKSLRMPAWVALRSVRGDDATMVAEGAGGVHVEWNRFSGDILIRTTTGRFVGTCQRGR